MKRTLSMLCVVVLLFTMHTLRRDANTLERIPMCGYLEEHFHTLDCYDGDALVCGRHEHIHTDACYQESPQIEPGTADLDIQDDAVVDPALAEQDMELSLSDMDFALDVEDVTPGLASNDAQEKSLSYALGEEAMLSGIIRALEMEIDFADIVDVGVVDDEATENDRIGIEKTGDDYRIWARKNFERMQLALILADDIMVITLVDGVAAPDVEEDIAPAGDDTPATEAAPAVDDTPATDDIPAVDDVPVEDVEAVEAVAPVAEEQTEVDTEAGEDAAPAEEAQATGQEQTEVDDEEEGETAKAEGEQSEEAAVPAEDDQVEEASVSIDADIVETQPASEDGEAVAGQAEEEQTEAQPAGEDEVTVEQGEEAIEEELEEAQPVGEGEVTVEQTDEGVVEAQPVEEDGEVAEQPEEAHPTDADDATVEQGEEEAVEEQPVEEDEVTVEQSEEEAVEEQPVEEDGATVEQVDPEAAEEQSEAEQSVEEDGATVEQVDPEAAEEQPEAEQSVEEDGATVEQVDPEAAEEQPEAEQPVEEDGATVGQDEEEAEQPEEEAVREQTAEDGEETTEQPEAQPAEEGEEAAEQTEEAQPEAQSAEDGEETTEQPEAQPAEEGEEAAEQTEEAQPVEEGEEATEGGEEEAVEISEAMDDGEAEDQKETEDAGEGESMEDERADEQPVITATVDLSGIAEYPLSLNALLAEAAPAVEAPVADVPAGESIENTAEESEEVEANTEPAEATAWHIEYDEALLSIEEAEGDYWITPLQRFEATEIIVDNGSRYALTLVNCALPEEEEAAEEPAIAYPAQDFEGRTEYVTVAVSAPEGAFPEGTTMAVADVEDEKTLTDIEDTVSEEFVEVKRVHAVDITFTDTEGNEIEPLMPISVVMRVEEIEQQQAAVVVHVDDAGATEVVESQSEAPAGETEVTVEMPATDASAAETTEDEALAEAAQKETSEEESSVGFEADTFSVYAIVVTETIETKYIDAAGATWNISVGYGPEAGIPAGATLAVEEVEGDYLEQTAELLKGRETITLARFFDITILDAEGNAVQPVQPVEVKATLAEQGEDAVKAVHFAEEGPELIEASQDEETVSFDAASFSVYGIVYTVDFHYTANGQTFDYGIPGGDCASLRDLLPALNVASDDPETEEDELETFMAAIADVTFSNPELVRVCPVEADTTVDALRAALGIESEYSAALTEADRAEIDARALTAPDWALFSLAPFTTDETLTVAMENGDSFAIAVTDAQIATRVLASDGQTYKITLTFGPEAEIPLDAELKAEEILYGEEAFQTYLTAAVEAIGNDTADTVVSFARFFDVQILKDGEKIEPKAAVDIRVEYDEPLAVDEAQALNVVHFAESGVEVIPEVVLGEAGNDVSYQQDSFSVSGTIITSTPSTSTLAPDSQEDFHKYMVLAKVDGEFYVVLNDGKLLKVSEYDSSSNTFETDYPMMWKYRTDTVDGNSYYNLYHPAEAVDYNGNQLASDFYWRYIDPNEVNGLSEDNAGNCILDMHEDVNKWCLYIPQASQRLQAPQAAVIYDETNHLLKSKNHPEWYIGVENVNGNLKISGQNPQSSAAEIYLADVTDDRLNPRGDKRNSVNHIDISVEGKAAVKVPLDYGDYYYVEGGQVKKFTVSRNNPVTVSLQKTVDVTQEDVKHAIVTAYTINEKGEHVPQPDMFIISGYSRNEHTEVDGQQLSTNQIRIEGIFKVADLRKVSISNSDMQANFDSQQRQDILNTLDNGYYNLDELPGSLGNGNGNAVIRNLRLNHPVYYTVSTDKLVTFDLQLNTGSATEGPKLYASEADARASMNSSLSEEQKPKPLTAKSMVTLSSSFSYWDKRNECPILRDPQYGTANYTNWQAGDIPYSFTDGGAGGGMDFVLGDSVEEDSGVLAVEITKYLVDAGGNRIQPSTAMTNSFKVGYSSAHQPTEVMDLCAGAYNEDQFTRFSSSGGYGNYIDLHTKKVTVGEDGMGTIYDYDVDAGMFYIEEDKNDIARQIVDKDGNIWNYTKTRIETEYVWRGDGIEGVNHVSKDYREADSNYLAIPEVLGNYVDVNGVDRFNTFLEFNVYNVYEPETDINVKKLWHQQNGAPVEAPDGAEVTVTLGRYKVVKDTENPVTGDLCIEQFLNTPNSWSAESTPFYATYRLKKDGKLVRSGAYRPGGHDDYASGSSGGAIIRDIPGGEYTLEIESSSKGYTVTNSPSSQTVTIINGQTAHSTVNSTLQAATNELLTIHVINRETDGNNTDPWVDRAFPFGAQVCIKIRRPGSASENSGFTLTMREGGNNALGDTYTRPAFKENEYADISQILTITLPNDKNDGRLYGGEYYVELQHNWGLNRVEIEEVFLKSTPGSSTSAPVAVDSQAASSTETPTAGMEGMKYVLDEAWTNENHTLTLAAAPWEEAMEHLDALDDDGYEYRYFIYDAVETGVEEGTEMRIVEGTSNGEEDLVVENTVPNRKPRLHIRKVDHKGNPLPGAEFSLAKADNSEAKAFTITASDGCVYTTDELEDGSYVIHETNAPAGYKLIEPADGTTDTGIYFTVQDMLISMDGGHSLPKGVTYDAGTYTLTAVNEPDITPGYLKVMKRWQNIEGVDEIPEDITSINVTLKRTRVAVNPKTLTVKVRDTVNNVTKTVGPVSVSTDDVTVTWYDKGQYNYDNGRMVYACNDASIHFTNVYHGVSGNDEKNVKFRLDGFSNTSQDNITVVFTYNVQNDSLNANDGDRGYWRDIVNDINPTVTQGNNPLKVPGVEVLDDFNVSQILSRANDWQYGWTIGGTDSNHNGYDYPAYDNSNRPYAYFVLETPITGYTTSYSINNMSGVQINPENPSDIVTVYNRRQSADVKVIKVDKDNKEQTLAGATFNLYQLNEDTPGGGSLTTVRETRTTSGDGLALFYGLEEGYYAIKEETPPQHYRVNGDGCFYIQVTLEGVACLERDETKRPSQWSVRSNDNMIAINDRDEITVGNELDEQPIALRKRSTVKDSNDKWVYIGGAEFQLYTLEEYVKGEGNRHPLNKSELDASAGTYFKSDDTTMVSISPNGNDNGRFYEGYLKLGTYVLVETKAPNGYVELSNPVVFQLITGGTPSSGNGSFKKNLLWQYYDPSKWNGTEYTETEWIKKSTDTKDTNGIYYYTLYVDNTPKGALSITKLVKLNGNAIADPSSVSGEIKNGSYMFSVAHADDKAHPFKYVQIKVENGVAVSYRIAGTEDQVMTINEWTPVENGAALVQDLVPGDYEVKEIPTGDFVLTGITGGKQTGTDGELHNDADLTAGTVTVTVTPGDTTATSAAANATYTNTTYRTRISILKIDKNDAQKKLTGAKFQLLQWSDSSKQYQVLETPGDGTDVNGQLSFSTPLAAGEYQIIETEMPAGYVKVDDNDIYFKIDKDGTFTRHAAPTITTEADNTRTVEWPADEIAAGAKVAEVTYAINNHDATFTVGNTPGVRLPSTGGHGTTLYHVLGTLMMLGAAILLVVKKRMQA